MCVCPYKTLKNIENIEKLRTLSTSRYVTKWVRGWVPRPDNGRYPETNKKTLTYLDMFIVFGCWHFVISSPPCRLLHDPTPRSRMSRAMERVRREVSSTAVVLYKGVLSEPILRERGNL